MKEEFLKAYDENEDGRIEIGEVRLYTIIKQIQGVY